MRAARPAAGADETELPAPEEERRINAVQESIPAVREGWCPCPTARAGSGSQIPPRPEWVAAPHLVASPPRIPRLGQGPAPGGFPALWSLGDPLPPRTAISRVTRVPRPRTPRLPSFQGIPLLTRLHPTYPIPAGLVPCPEDRNPSPRRRLRFLQPWLWPPPLILSLGGLPGRTERGPGSCCALQLDLS